MKKEYRQQMHQFVRIVGVAQVPNRFQRWIHQTVFRSFYREITPCQLIVGGCAEVVHWYFIFERDFSTIRKLITFAFRNHQTYEGPYVRYRFETSQAVAIIPLTHKSTGTILALALGLHLSVRMTPVPAPAIAPVGP